MFSGLRAECLSIVSRLASILLDRATALPSWFYHRAPCCVHMKVYRMLMTRMTVDVVYVSKIDANSEDIRDADGISKKKKEHKKNVG